MIDEEKDQTVFVFSTSIALSAFLAQIFLNPEKRNPQQWDLSQSDLGQVPQLPSGLGNLTNQTLVHQHQFSGTMNSI